jgi:hypothetical protein
MLLASFKNWNALSIVREICARIWLDQKLTGLIAQ